MVSLCIVRAANMTTEALHKLANNGLIFCYCRDSISDASGRVGHLWQIQITKAEAYFINLKKLYTINYITITLSPDAVDKIKFKLNKRKKKSEYE